MKIAVVYVYPITGELHHDAYAIRFMDSYRSCPTGIDHHSVIVCNGGAATTAVACMFGSMRNCTLVQHDDSGWDNGAYQKAAREIPADLMIFFGGSSYIRGPGWLERIMDAWDRRGPALYGAMGNRTNTGSITPHIRTTGFWMPPALLNEYPTIVTTREQRYPFEHGPDSLTQWVLRRGLKAYVVNWIGEHEEPNWNVDPNGFHQGNQGRLMFGDRLTEPPFYPIP